MTWPSAEARAGGGAEAYGAWSRNQDAADTGGNWPNRTRIWRPMVTTVTVSALGGEEINFNHKPSLTKYAGGAGRARETGAWMVSVVTGLVRAKKSGKSNRTCISLFMTI
jgi:hypothetical protein